MGKSTRWRNKLHMAHLQLDTICSAPNTTTVLTVGFQHLVYSMERDPEGTFIIAYHVSKSS